MSNLWSGRFAGEPDKDVFEFGRVVPVRQAPRRGRHHRQPGVGRGDRARRRARRPTSTRRIDRGLDGAPRARCAPIRVIVQGDDEDVHACVERQLVERVGDAGKRLHTGPLAQRAGQRRSAALPAAAAVAIDQPDRARRRGARRSGRAGRRRADAGLHASAARAAGARRALVPVARRRVPPRRRALRRGVARGRRAAARLGRDRRQLATASTSTRWRARLGFSRVVANSMDAVADRDFVVDASSTPCRCAMVHVSRLAEDVIIFGSEEFGFFDLDDRVSTGSSLMPQKKNPDPMELVRGKAGRAIGRLTGLLDDDEGPAERLQQGPAGRQGSRVRRRGHRGRLA